MTDGLTVRRATPEEIRMLGGAEYVTSLPAVAPVPAPAPAPPPTVAAPAAVAAAQGAPVVAETDDGTVVLSKTYMAHGQPVARIKLRRPTGRDMKAIKENPFRPVIDDKNQLDRLEVKWDVLCTALTVLADPPLPPSTVDQFEFRDLDDCAGVLARFFLRLA